MRAVSPSTGSTPWIGQLQNRLLGQSAYGIPIQTTALPKQWFFSFWPDDEDNDVYLSLKINKKAKSENVLHQKQANNIHNKFNAAATANAAEFLLHGGCCCCGNKGTARQEGKALLMTRTQDGVSQPPSFIKWMIEWCWWKSKGMCRISLRPPLIASPSKHFPLNAYTRSENLIFRPNTTNWQLCMYSKI